MQVAMPAVRPASPTAESGPILMQVSRGQASVPAPRTASQRRPCPCPWTCSRSPQSQRRRSSRCRSLSHLLPSSPAQPPQALQRPTHTQLASMRAGKKQHNKQRAASCTSGVFGGGDVVVELLHAQQIPVHRLRETHKQRAERTSQCLSRATQLGRGNGTLAYSTRCSSCANRETAHRELRPLQRDRKRSNTATQRDKH